MTDRNICLTLVAVGQSAEMVWPIQAALETETRAKVLITGKSTRRPDRAFLRTTDT